MKTFINGILSMIFVFVSVISFCSGFIYAAVLYTISRVGMFVEKIKLTRM